MADPDLQIRWGGHPDPGIKGEGSPKNFLRLFGPQFGLKIRGAGPGPAPPLDPPLTFIVLLIPFHIQKLRILMDIILVNARLLCKSAWPAADKTTEVK